MRISDWSSDVCSSDLAVLSDVEYAASAYAAAEGAAATVIVTEWDAFRALDLTRLKAAMADPLLVDLRNIYRPAQAEAAGLRYVGIGRPGEPVEDTDLAGERRSEEHTSELPSIMRL